MVRLCWPGSEEIIFTVRHMLRERFAKGRALAQEIALQANNESDVRKLLLTVIAEESADGWGTTGQQEHCCELLRVLRSNLELVSDWLIDILGDLHDLLQANEDYVRRPTVAGINFRTTKHRVAAKFAQYHEWLGSESTVAMWEQMLENLGFQCYADDTESLVSIVTRHSILARIWRKVRDLRVTYEAQVRTCTNEDRDHFQSEQWLSVPSWAHELAINLSLVPLPTVSEVETISWQHFHQHTILSEKAANPMPDEREQAVHKYTCGWVLAKLVTVIKHSRRISPNTNEWKYYDKKNIFHMFVEEWRPLVIPTPSFVSIFSLITNSLRTCVTKYTIACDMRTIFQKARQNVLNDQVVVTKWKGLLQSARPDITDEELKVTLDRTLTITQKVLNPEVLRMYKLGKQSRASTAFRASLASAKAQRNREEYSEQPTGNRRSKRPLEAMAQRESRKAAAAAEAAKRKKEREIQRQQAQQARELARVVEHNRRVDIFATRRGTRLVRAARRFGDDAISTQPSDTVHDNNELLQVVMTELEGTHALNNRLQQELHQATSAKRRLELDTEVSSKSKRNHVVHTLG